MNLGVIRGGTVVNRVPHEAETEWECRATAPEALAEADRAFAALNGPGLGGASLAAERTGFTAAWPGGSATQTLFEHWNRAAKAMDLTAVAVPRGGLSDANHLCHLGPTLDGLGPGGGNPHCSRRAPDGSERPEYLDPSTLAPKAVMNALALASLLGGQENYPVD